MVNNRDKCKDSYLQYSGKGKNTMDDDINTL